MPEDAQESAAHSTLQGHAPDVSDPVQLRAAIDQAVDYRGDVTVRTRSGTIIEGYIFDRRADGQEPYLRMMLKDTTRRLTIAYADIDRLQFSGRDTAAGKSWETWLRQYVEKKRRGEAANREAEPLEDFEVKK